MCFTVNLIIGSTQWCYRKAFNFYHHSIYSTGRTVQLNCISKTVSYCFRESCSNVLGQVFKQDPLLQRKATGSFAGIRFAELVLVYDVVTQRAREF